MIAVKYSLSGKDYKTTQMLDVLSVDVLKTNRSGKDRKRKNQKEKNI